jgi:co-chaperonin GroES (HSP10)
MKAYGKRLIVERKEPDSKVGNIILPEGTKKKTTVGKVLSVGKEVSDITQNDIVYFAPFSGVEYELDNKKLVIINAEDVLAFEETPSDYQYEPLNVPVAPNS